MPLIDLTLRRPGFKRTAVSDTEASGGDPGSQPDTANASAEPSPNRRGWRVLSVVGGSSGWLPADDRGHAGVEAGDEWMRNWTAGTRTTQVTVS